MTFEKNKPIPRLLSSLDTEKYVVIDKTTGITVSTNLVIAPWPKKAEEQTSLLFSNSRTIEYAEKHGMPLYYLKARKPKE